MTAQARATTRPKKSPVWLPYLQSVKETKRGVFEFVFNGGEETIPADQILSIMVYGDADTKLDTRTLTKLCGRGIPIVIHRRNVPRPIIICSGPRADPDDTLSAHLIKRSQSRVATHITRRLLQAKMQSMTYLVDPLPLPDFADVDKLRNVEAIHAKKYWDSWFMQLGHPEWFRRTKNPASEALDAVSKFLSGITLRWITYHNLSPYHGFLHTPTDYPTLIYDLLEPYRGLSDFIVLKTILATDDEKLWIPHCIEAIKGWLNSQTYVPLTRQIVTNQELFHGIVLSLKYYLLGQQRVFHVPLPGKPQGGRPAKVVFKLYGRHAGKTDFWTQAKLVTNAPYEPNIAELTSETSPHAKPLVSSTADHATTVTATPAAPAPARENSKPPKFATTATGRKIRTTPALPSDYCVIDIETTGLVASNDSIIELAALRVHAEKIEDNYSVLVHNPTPLNQIIRDLTGLTDEILLHDGIDIADALTAFCDFIGTDALIGHNIGFDMRFINQALYIAHQQTLVNKTIDTRSIARRMMPGRHSYKLQDLADDLGFGDRTQHRALDDCKTTQKLVTALYAKN